MSTVAAPKADPKATQSLAKSPGVLAFFRSTLGSKLIMAVTGLAMIGFLVGHMAGNLLVFAGQDALNAYAQTLKSTPLLLWGARAGLLACLALHVLTGLRLAALNKAARPQGYAYEDTIQASLASRTMVLTGLLVLAYIGYHLSHFTLGLTHPEHFKMVDAQGRHDVFGMVVEGFQSPAVAGSYLVAMAVMAVHVSHGFGSLFRTLGVSDVRLRDKLRKLGVALSVALFLGFSSIPVAILAGWVTLPGGAQ